MSGDSRQRVIQEMAYAKWEQAGWPAGDGVNFWLAAEQDFLSQQSTKPNRTSRGSIKASLVAADPPPLKITKTPSKSRKKAS